MDEMENEDPVLTDELVGLRFKGNDEAGATLDLIAMQ
jgi:hypothetical protein